MNIITESATDEIYGTHFHPKSENLLTVVGRRLKSYPIRIEQLIEQTPRRLLPAERKFYSVLDDQDWPKE